jgi:M6 family metalloprotease-like protein
MNTSARPCCLAWFVAIALCLACGQPDAHAQLVADDATNVIENATNVLAASLTVGTNGSNTLLIVTNQGVLNVASNLWIGENASSFSNTVVVTGAGSRVDAVADVIVGVNGSSNRLLIADGARVEGERGRVGGGGAASGNEAVVTDPGSAWISRSTFFVGNFGSANRLIVSNGGLVQSASGALGNQAGSSNNSALVTGAGSAWTNSGDLYVGDAGSGNRLVISNGGLVQNSWGRVGFQTGSAGNRVEVVGTGSLWTNSGVLFIGQNGSGNQLQISGGGQVNNLGDGFIGANLGSDSNIVVVRDTGSYWSNRNELLVGQSGSANQLLISDGGVVSAVTGILGRNTGSTGNALTVSDPGSLLLLNSNLYVGSNGWGNRLVVSNGGAVFANISYLGASATSSNNLFVLTGGGSVMTNQLHLHVGEVGAGNQLVVSNGGSIQNGDHFWIGNQTGSSNNSVLIAGVGSSIVNQNGTRVGNSGSWNILVVSNSGWLSSVFGGDGFIGFGANSASNLAIVTGAGSVWSNASDLFIGNSGSGNSLLVTNGGFITNGGATQLGVSATSSNNVLMVTGTGSRIATGAGFRVGQNGSGNQAVITAGGTVAAVTGGWIGSTSVSSNNLMVVSGSGSSWQIWSNLAVGDAGAWNSLLISNGARVVNEAGRIGNNVSSWSNRVIVAGPGSLWSNRGDLFVGGNGSSGNHLVITDGGKVQNVYGRVGAGGSSHSNRVIVSGAGALWTNTTGLFMGVGSDNWLIISNGGSVRIGAIDTWIASSPTSSNNVVWITGNGSQLGNGGAIRVGNTGSANLLVITNGGLAHNGGANLGFDDTSFNNAVVVTGAGSLWSNRNDLFVGRTGAVNTVTVSGGAVVRNNNGHVGFASVSTNNAVLVTGGGSLWSNANDLFVGNGGSGNRLVIESNAIVRNAIGRVGELVGSSNNSVLVTGVGSLWSNALDLIVGNGGSGNSLTITNGGVVRNDNGRVADTPGSVANVVRVTGAGSLWTNSGTVFIGREGSGNRLLLDDGGAVQSASDGFVGAGTASDNNLALVSGAGSVWRSAGELRVGGQGSLNAVIVSNGGAVVNNNGSIGGSTGASANRAVVTGTGSQWLNNSSLNVGDSGSSGTLLVRDGGLVRNSLAYIGAGIASASNAVLVTDPGSRLENLASLYVGYSGSASELIVSNGGTVTVATTLGIGWNASSSNNLVRNSGGNLLVTNTGGTALLEARRGALALDGGLTRADQLLIGAEGVLTGSGTVQAGGTVTNFGIIRPGASAGALTIDAGLSLQSSAVLAFEIGGLIATNDYDRLNVTSLVEFAGTLSLTLLNDFLPAPADTFTLLSFGSATGAFANVTAGRVNLTNNLASFAVTQTATSLVLGAVQYADNDGDGQGDLQEQAAGTDPGDSTSVLAITSLTRNASGHTVVRFQSVAGKNYRVEYSHDLITWLPVIGASFSTPAVGVTEWVDDGTLTGGLAVPRRVYRVGLAGLPIVKRALCVIVDFADSTLEGYNTGQSGTVTNQTEVRAILDQMEAHWQWMSVGAERLAWDITRIQLNTNLTSTAFASWTEFRAAVVNKAFEQVNVSDYDYDGDERGDVMFAIVSSGGQYFDYLVGGASASGGVAGVHNGSSIFVDGQDSLSIRGRNIGNFNHEAGHCFGLPDLYGTFDNVQYLTLMSSSWGAIPHGMSAWDRMRLGWLTPTVVTQTTAGMVLYPAEERLQAVVIPTARNKEFFMIEYRKRPTSGFGSAMPVPVDGLAIYHVNELKIGAGNNNVLPQLLRLEAVDGQVDTADSPALMDFWYPENPIMTNGFRGIPYYAQSVGVEVTNISRTVDGGIAFDVIVHDMSLPPTPEFVVNGNFETGGGAIPDNWTTGGWIPAQSTFTWEAQGGISNSRCIRIQNNQSNDAFFEQPVSGLTVGRTYTLSGWIKLESNPNNHVDRGACLAINGTWTHSPFLYTVGDWNYTEVAFTAQSTTVMVGARLGFWGGDLIGAARFDNLSVVEQ